MLNFVLGRQQSGKTFYLINKAAKAVSEDKQVIMLVPEQFNFECQRLLLESLGPTVSNKIEIHSFTSLCKAICAEIGGLSGITVDDGMRYLLGVKAVSGVADNLRHYARYKNSPEFIKEVVSVITEMKQCAVSNENLRELSMEVSSPTFADKLYDISLIMSAYDALLSGRFADPLDLISKTVESMDCAEFFKGKTVIIDEFKGFTAAQFAMLERIVRGSDEVYAAFCCDSDVSKADIDVFANVKHVVMRMKSFAKKYGVQIGENVVLKYQHAVTDSIAAIEQFLSGEIKTCENITPEITICRAADIYGEVDFVMSKIRRLVRENGYRYRDFVIISRSADVYLPIIESSADKYNIPCFTDSRVAVKGLPLAVFVLSALKACQDFDTQNILKYLKTGLTAIQENDISEVENYTFVWNISGKKWLDNWDMNPAGLKDAKGDEDKLNRLNEIRKAVVMPIINLEKSCHGTAEDMCRAVMKFLADCKTDEALDKYTNSLELQGKLEEAEYQRAGYEVFIKTLDKICAVSAGDILTVAEFASLLAEALSFETVGEIPQTKDQVIYGTADRIRPMRPKAVFVIGVNQDVFPSPVKTNGLFSPTERQIMINGGFEVADNAVTDALDEKFLFYYSCTVASKQVFLSYSENSSDGSAMEPAAEISEIKQALPNCNYIDYGYVNGAFIDGIEAEVPAFEALALNFKTISPEVAALKEYFKNHPDYKAKYKALELAVANKAPSLSKAAAALIYGDEIKLSASKIEDFGGCHFAFFCKYGLNVKRLDKVEFDALTRGNIVHFVLEQFINAHKDDIGTLDESIIKAETEELCDLYIKTVGADESSLDERFTYMLSIIKKTAVYITTALNNEFAQSEFKPKYCELEVGDGAPLEAIKVKTAGGASVSLRGSIDRVDTTPDGKLRVVDYKTGTKNFKLSSVLDGVNMQMLLYLYAAVKNGKELLNADIPAGILYFPARRDLEKGKGSYIKMNGLIKGDAETVRQMEKDCGGEIIPAKLLKDGESFSATSSVVTADDFSVIFKYLDNTLAEIGSKITGGDILISPLKIDKDNTWCKYCDYRSVCRIDDKDNCRERSEGSIAEVLEIMRKETEGE